VPLLSEKSLHSAGFIKAGVVNYRFHCSHNAMARGMIMASTHELLEKIAALRQRLDQAQGLASAASTVAAAIENHGSHSLPGPHFRERGRGMNDDLLDRTLRQLPDLVNPPEQQTVFPSRLTARSFRLLKNGRELLQQLRELGEAPHVADDDNTALGACYRQSVAMIDAVLRMVQAFPEAPSAQYRLCDGLEAILHIVRQRLTALKTAFLQRHQVDVATHTLATLLVGLVQGKKQSLQDYRPLAQRFLDEAEQDLPMTFAPTPADQPAIFVAAHSCNVAQVVARLVHRDLQWQDRKEHAVLAALLHDVGMLRVPIDVLRSADPLNDEQRRSIEKHTQQGSDFVGRLTDCDSWLKEAAASHHERVDGTGYPAGLLSGQFSSLVQLLSVCDVYAAMCVDRPYRAALETRTALTDTLMLAEQGALNRFETEKLVQLGFYPVGSVVELQDGGIGVVMCATSGAKPLDPARPTLTLFFDREGAPLAIPRHLDLATETSRSILRSLPAHERYHILGSFSVLV